MGGDDGTIRLYKVMSKDFKEQFQMVCELKEGGHLDSIYSVDISPGKSLLLASGNDNCATVWNLGTRKCVKKLTFRDKTFRDARGNEDKSNFLMRGGVFTNCGRYAYLLSCKMRYKSFLIKYSVSMT